MHTTVYLIRNAETAWNQERRLAGRRELGLSDKGLATSHNLVKLFEGIPIDEVLTSPLPRAVDTAKILAAARGLEVARDPRLIDWQAGEWEGRMYEDIMKDPRYTAFLGLPPSEITMPGGEGLNDTRLRLQSSVEQALSDNELGSNIALVSHAGPLRLLLSHYLSIPPWDHARLRLEPGSVTVLNFTSLTAPPTLRALNCTRPLLDTLGSAR